MNRVSAKVELKRRRDPRILVPPPLIVACTLLAGVWSDGRLDRWPVIPSPWL